MSNLKMKGIAITDCPEVEGLEPCAFFGRGLCPHCYAERAYRLRVATSGGLKATGRGIVRLGTWIEVLPRHYRRFKELFPSRRYFTLTRGLNPMEMYKEMEGDPLALNIQVSVDYVGRYVPDEDRLHQLLALSKAFFRLKTTDDNAAKLAELGIPRRRVIETPLRGKKWAYGRTTPLEKLGWPYKEFLRCNTPCRECVAENGLVACLVTPRFDPARMIYGPPPRQSMYVQVPWQGTIREAIRTLGEVQDVDGRPVRALPLSRIYEYFLSQYPAVVYKPTWQFRVRVAVQQCAVHVGKGVWGLPAKAEQQVLLTSSG
jgi:hypothetical protein